MKKNILIISILFVAIALFIMCGPAGATFIIQYDAECNPANGEGTQTMYYSAEGAGSEWTEFLSVTMGNGEAIDQSAEIPAGDLYVKIKVEFEMGGTPIEMCMMSDETVTIVEGETYSMKMTYDPENPDADENGCIEESVEPEGFDPEEGMIIVDCDTDEEITME